LLALLAHHFLHVSRIRVKITSHDLNSSAQTAGLVGNAKKNYTFYKVRAFPDRPRNHYHLQKTSASCTLSEKGHITQKWPGLPGMGVRRKQYTDKRAYLKYMTEILVKEKRRRAIQHR
jgi:hypothetical protein